MRLRPATPGTRTSWSWSRCSGRLVPNPTGLAQRVGMVPAEGAALAQHQGHHLEVATPTSTLEP
jgi:hypothetical protein